ncbi:hypothetical protein [Nioella sediminis]|uniref:hypothetical protein n=1 Tax=Nioella sediminis TaxID=1912092 RepID=UPI0009F80E9B|nr:hypothetical protein [Nioella sediminis]
MSSQSSDPCDDKAAGAAADRSVENRPRTQGVPDGPRRATRLSEGAVHAAREPCYHIAMRALVLLAILTSPAHAWQAGSEGRVCTLRHSGPAADVWLTYDPDGPLYSITVTTPAPWPDAPVFGLQFDGSRPNIITTTRHERDETGHSLTVTDQGFGNVLDGLEYNRTATAFAGQGLAQIDLTGAAPEVQIFRACTTIPSV